VKESGSFVLTWLTIAVMIGVQAKGCHDYAVQIEKAGDVAADLKGRVAVLEGARGEEAVQRAEMNTTLRAFGEDMKEIKSDVKALLQKKR
jgi:hypothetical protein